MLPFFSANIKFLWYVVLALIALQFSAWCVAWWFIVFSPYRSLDYVSNLHDNQLTADQIKAEISTLDKDIKRNESIWRFTVLFSAFVWWQGAFLSQNKHIDATNALRARREYLVELYNNKMFK